MDAQTRLAMKMTICLVSAIAGWSLGGEAHAHHSFPVHFVPEGRVTVSGVVTEFRFRNPHGLIFLDVAGDDGEVVAWKVETNSPSILRRRGWSEESLKAGDAVTIVGYPARDGTNYMRVLSVELDDGRELTGQRPAEAVDDGKD